MSEDADFRTRTRIHVDIKGSLDVRNLAGTVEQRLARLSGAGGGAFSVFTGTAADLLGPSQLLPLFEAVICAGALT